MNKKKTSFPRSVNFPNLIRSPSLRSAINLYIQYIYIYIITIKFTFWSNSFSFKIDLFFFKCKLWMWVNNEERDQGKSRLLSCVYHLIWSATVMSDLSKCWTVLLFCCQHSFWWILKDLLVNLGFFLWLKIFLKVELSEK